MQYGNFFEKMKITIREHCLNRTMQYGNRKAAAQKKVRREGLNRTMQYGNFSFLHIFGKIEQV